MLQKLQALLEQSVTNQHKSLQYQKDLDNLEAEISRLKKDQENLESNEFKTQLQREIERLVASNKQLQGDLKERKRELVAESQKRREFDSWFEEKVAVEFQMERELQRERTLKQELFKNQEVFENEIVKLNELIERKTQELQEKQ